MEAPRVLKSLRIPTRVECYKKTKSLNDICSKNIHVTLLPAIIHAITLQKKEEKLNRRHEESFGKERNV